MDFADAEQRMKYFCNRNLTLKLTIQVYQQLLKDNKVNPVYYCGGRHLNNKVKTIYKKNPFNLKAHKTKILFSNL